MCGKRNSAAVEYHRSQPNPRQHRQHKSAYVGIRQHMAAYGSIRQHTAAYGSILQHTSTLFVFLGNALCKLYLRIEGEKGK